MSANGKPSHRSANTSEGAGLSPHRTRARLLEETAILEVFLDDDVSDGVKHKLDVLCVCGACHVGVDLFDVSSQVELQELQLDVDASILVGVGSC